MRQFDICLIKSERVPRQKILILQHDRFEQLKTRIASPLILLRLVKAASAIYPVLTLDNEDYLVAFNEISTVPLGQIGTVIASARDRHTDFIAAIDMMFTGY